MRKFTTKEEKEQEIIRATLYLRELDNVGAYGYFYMSLLWDIIAYAAFGIKHDHAGHTLYPEGDEGIALDNKIRAVVNNMESKGLIKISKSRKMFRITM